MNQNNALDTAGKQAGQGGLGGGIFAGVTAYHWLVVIIAAAAWTFDCMDQRLFVLSRQAALEDLLAGKLADGESVAVYSGYVTAAFMLGWATGGILFGMMSDKVGRVRTMVFTLLIYSMFTGLSGMAVTWMDFAAYRFITGLGVGGMFGAATTLVAETVPGGFRPLALGSLQILAAFGNMGGALISLIIQPGAETSVIGMAGWRTLFFVGIVPAALVVPILFVLREPEAWKAVRDEARSKKTRSDMGSPLQLFRHPKWRRHTLVGLGLGVAGMVGLWSIGFYSPELIKTALAGQPQQTVDTATSRGMALYDVGTLLGMTAFTLGASFLSRRFAFLVGLLFSFVTTVFVFTQLKSVSDVYWMPALMGFAQLSLFAGYSIYFPELFPTRLRGTGVGFCYNTVRYVAAPAPILLGYMSQYISFRAAACVMASVYFVGVIALIWAPETKGKPLPEDEPAESSGPKTFAVAPD